MFCSCVKSAAARRAKICRHGAPHDIQNETRIEPFEPPTSVAAPNNAAPAAAADGGGESRGAGAGELVEVEMRVAHAEPQVGSELEGANDAFMVVDGDGVAGAEGSASGNEGGVPAAAAELVQAGQDAAEIGDDERGVDGFAALLREAGRQQPAFVIRYRREPAAVWQAQTIGPLGVVLQCNTHASYVEGHQLRARRHDCREALTMQLVQVGRYLLE